MKNIILMAIVCTVLACAVKKNQVGVVVPKSVPVARIAGISTDSTYGFTPQNPVQSGGGPAGEQAYLNAIAGPNGEPVKYYRKGSCCPVESAHGMMGMAMLDMYMVTYAGISKNVTIYINMYDVGEMKAPVGFTVRR